MDKNTYLIFRLRRRAVSTLFFLIIVQQLSSIRSLSSIPERISLCPKGYEYKDKYCYSLKGPETFLDKFISCRGNVFTFELYKNLSLPSPNGSLWTDYTSLFPGAVPFIDWSYTTKTGTPINTTEYKITGENNATINDVACVVYDPAKSFSIVRCDERHYRYCVVEEGIHIYKKVSLTLGVDRDTTQTHPVKLTVRYNTPGRAGQLLHRHIMCFTDSSLYNVRKVELSRTYHLMSPYEGYYWCKQSGASNFDFSQSNHFLYIKNPKDYLDTYAVKVKSSKSYTLDSTEINELLREKLTEQLGDYLHYTTEYSETVKESNHSISSLIKYKSEHPSSVTHNLILKTDVKRLYLDYKTVLLHVKLRPGVKPVKPGQWMDLSVEYMRPVYYCDRENNFHLGQNRTVAGKPCVTEICGTAYSFNVGVEIITVPDEKCSPPSNVTDPKNEKLDVINEMENIVNSSDPITEKDFNGVFSRADRVIFSEELDIDGHFLKLLDESSTRINMRSRPEYKVVGNSIALLVAEASPLAKIKGFRVADRISDKFNAFNIFHTAINSTLMSESEIVVYFPPSVFDIKRRVSFLMFRKIHPFQIKNSKYQVNSMVISIKVENLTNFLPEEAIVIYMKPSKLKQMRSQTRTCAFWQFYGDGTGSWSQEGCNFTRASQPDQLDICTCNHLTHFAEILVSRTTFSKSHENLLETISIIGSCFSIIGLLFVGLTAALLSPWRQNFSNKVWLQLSISILILCCCFLISIFAQFEENDYFCPLTGIVLHYSVLSSFCWMLVAAVVSYRRLVAVLSVDPTHKLLRASVFAWGVPLIVVGILLSVAPHSYDGQYEEKSPSGTFCYPSGLALWLAVYAPIALMLLLNLTLFMLIVSSVFCQNRPMYQNRIDAKEAYRCALVSFLLVFLFGLPWLFGLLSSNVVFSYLFTIFVTFQGFVLFFFFVGNKKTRDMWLVKLKVKQIRNTVTTSTGTRANNEEINLR